MRRRRHATILPPTTRIRRALTLARWIATVAASASLALAWRRAAVARAWEEGLREELEVPRGGGRGGGEATRSRGGGGSREEDEAAALLRRDPRPEPTEHRLDPTTPEPIRFVAVVGLYHSGTKGMWNSIRQNEGVAAERGVDLRAYGAKDDGGYPQCGVPLRSDSTVDASADAAMGGSYDRASARREAVWGDWKNLGDGKVNGLLDEKRPHEIDVFYTWWKHTPPQHPMLACFRPDTLYVVMTRHPKAWQVSATKAPYDFKYDPSREKWTLIRQRPRRLPPLALYFDALSDAWAYWTRGYLAWEEGAAGRHCNAPGAGAAADRRNCLGGANEISPSRRNVVVVRYEEYLMNPKKTLAQIFSFATRGAIDAKADEDEFVPSDPEKLERMRDSLIKLRRGNFFSMKSTKAHSELCDLLGYSCDESGSLFNG